MALDKVIQAILEDGRKEAERIVTEGKQEAQKSLYETRKEAEKLISEKSEEANKLAQRMKTQESARAEIESKKVVLKAQKEFLDEVYGAALKRLGEKWSAKLIENTLKNKSSEVKGGFVYSNERDKGAVQGLVGTYGGQFGGVIDCNGGVIIENSDGSVRTDYRLETLLKDVWDDSIIEVTSILWGKEEKK
jgi:V/A-type H+-transporting ATPase subunit E